MVKIEISFRFLRAYHFLDLFSATSSQSSHLSSSVRSCVLYKSELLGLAGFTSHDVLAVVRFILCFLCRIQISLA